MYVHRFRAALAAAAILSPMRAVAAVAPGAEAPRPAVLQLAAPAAALDVSFTHSGRRGTVPPEAVVLTFESVTPARAGLAFAHPERLQVVSGESAKLEFPAADYEKLRGGLFDSGRREMLSFRIPTEQLVAMAAESELELKAGDARMRLHGRAMDMLRDIARQLRPASAEAS